MQDRVLSKATGGNAFMRRHTVLAAFLFASWPVQAEPVALDDEALKHAVAGKTVHLDTPLGIAIPIVFHGNGMMSGQAGVLSYILGAEKDRGRWWIAEGKLCQRWFNWLDAKPNCMRVQQDGSKVFWQSDDGKSGTATIASALPPGAKSAPSGLGGPANEEPRPRRSLSADEPQHRLQPQSERVPWVTASAVAKPVPTPVRVPRPAPRAKPDEVAQAPTPALQHGRWLEAERLPWAERPDRWCHAAETDAAEQDIAPDLVVVTRLSYDFGSAIPPTNACLSDEPALRQLAKVGVEPR
jgi:hypothetical protein